MRQLSQSNLEFSKVNPRFYVKISKILAYNFHERLSLWHLKETFPASWIDFYPLIRKMKEHQGLFIILMSIYIWSESMTELIVKIVNHCRKNAPLQMHYRDITMYLLITEMHLQLLTNTWYPLHAYNSDFYYFLKEIFRIFSNSLTFWSIRLP